MDLRDENDWLGVQGLRNGWLLAKDYNRLHYGGCLPECLEKKRV
jgi:hypothetical protein